MTNKRQIHVKITDNEIYEVEAEERLDKKIAIRRIVLYHRGNDGRPVGFRELSSEIQDEVIRKVQEEFQE